MLLSWLLGHSGQSHSLIFKPTFRTTELYIEQEKKTVLKPTFRTTELYYERLQDNIYLIYV